MTPRAPSARERAKAEVEPFLGEVGGVEGLERRLLDRSGLPGPRANLELAAAFADCVAERGLGPWEWALIRRWLEVPADSPDRRAEYLPVCALQALGAAYARADSDGQREALASLRAAAVDSRWRVREAVVIGLQRLGEADADAFGSIVLDWATDGSPLVRRAVLAALAHPPILRDDQAARMALAIAAEIFDGYAAVPLTDRREPDVQVLKRGLEYAPSVLVAAAPDVGFEWLTRMAESADAEVRRIVRENLGKARLAARHPRRVTEVLACLSC